MSFAPESLVRRLVEERVEAVPTNVRDPSYYHKVVDCRWACPPHTTLPEYIRLIAQGRYTDAYVVNRESNVRFPPKRASSVAGAT